MSSAAIYPVTWSQSIGNTVMANSKLQINLAYASRPSTKRNFEISFPTSEKLYRALKTCRELTRKQGDPTQIAMKTAGFQYTIQSERSSNGDSIRSICSSDQISTSSSIRNCASRIPSISNEESPSKRQKTEVNSKTCYPRTLVEVGTFQEVRRRTFSHWSHRISPSRTQMIDAGFFNCNVGDRTICLYCNLICQQWTPHVDDPWLVHKTLSPRCPYVISMSACRDNPSIRIVNDNSVDNRSSTTDNHDLFRSNEIVLTAACHVSFVEIPKRHASFSNWPNEALPSVNDLVRAGFFYSGIKTIVTCFYCNGSLQNWGPTDNPTVEHARWFPHCAYAKQLCGDDLYRRIQESKRAAQGFSEFF